MSKHSYVTLTPDVARDLALKKLAAIERCRDRDRQVFIEGECARRNNGFFHKLFRMSPVMPLTVIHEQNNMDKWNSELWAIEHFNYGHSETLAKQVLVATAHGDPINLSLEDMDRLAEPKSVTKERW